MWDVRNLEQYGITYNKSCHEHNLDFEKINNLEIRKEVKKYMKQRLIANNKFSWASAYNYMKYIPLFINFISELEPTWIDLKNLGRQHILKYIEWLNIYAKDNPRRRNTNHKVYIRA